MMDELSRALGPLGRRIRLMLGRAVLGLMADAVKVQVKGLDGEIRDNAELFQQYGFRSWPMPGAEGIVLSLGGNRDHTVIVCMDDRRVQLDLLAAGEVALYDHLGKHVHLKADGSIVAKADTEFRIDAPRLACTGEIVDRCDSGGVSMSEMRDMHNGHDHPENDAGGPTDPPRQVF